MLVRNGRILLCRNVTAGYWYLPGGHVECEEGAKAALAREFMEETGARITVGALMLVTEGTFRTRKKRHHEINLVFHVEHRSKSNAVEVRSREAGIAFDWRSGASVRRLDLRPRAIKGWLAANVGIVGTAPSAPWRSDLS